VTAGPSDLAPGERSASAVVLANKKARIPLTVTAPPAGRRTDGALPVSLDSNEAASMLRGERTKTLQLQQAMGMMREQFDRLSREFERRDRDEVSWMELWLVCWPAGRTISALHRARLQVHLRREHRHQGRAVQAPVAAHQSGQSRRGVHRHQQGHRAFELDELRLTAEPYDIGERPYAMRAQKKVIAPGESGRFALLIPQRLSKCRPRRTNSCWSSGVQAQRGLTRWLPSS